MKLSDTYLKLAKVEERLCDALALPPISQHDGAHIADRLLTIRLVTHHCPSQIHQQELSTKFMSSVFSIAAGVAP